MANDDNLVMPRSELGQKRKSGPVRARSVDTLIADIASRLGVSKKCQQRKWPTLFDHLIDGSKHGRRMYQAEQDHAFEAREAWITSLINPTRAITPPTKLPAIANRPSPTGIA
jgi:hypothetical protein